jgi:uncharacterized protein
LLNINNIAHSDTNTKTKKEFRDPIPGFIPQYDHELKIIDDPVFQRLRGIRQLSFAYLVYHGAEHSRFGHALGTMHIVDRALEKIVKNSDNLGFPVDINDYDRKLARYAISPSSISFSYIYC